MRQVPGWRHSNAERHTFGEVRPGTNCNTHARRVQITMNWYGQGVMASKWTLDTCHPGQLTAMHSNAQVSTWPAVAKVCSLKENRYCGLYRGKAAAKNDAARWDDQILIAFSRLEKQRKAGKKSMVKLACDCVDCQQEPIWDKEIRFCSQVKQVRILACKQFLVNQKLAC